MNYTWSFYYRPARCERHRYCVKTDDAAFSTTHSPVKKKKYSLLATFTSILICSLTSQFLLQYLTGISLPLNCGPICS